MRLEYVPITERRNPIWNFFRRRLGILRLEGDSVEVWKLMRLHSDGLRRQSIALKELQAEVAEYMKRLESENAALRRERDDALLAADIVKDLATPPISDADVERMIAEAKRVRQEIEGEH